MKEYRNELNVKEKVIPEMKKLNQKKHKKNVNNQKKKKKVKFTTEL